jgi:phosphate transport system protein
MRDAFRKELESLDQAVVQMGALVENSIEAATTALIESDKDLAAKVRDGDDAIDALFMDIEERSLILLAQQAPVARDLRLVVAILGSINDLERAGDLAYNVAKLVQREESPSGSTLATKEIRSLLAELGTEARLLFGAAIDAWAQKNEVLAAELGQRDDRLDHLHKQVITSLVGLKGEEVLPAAIRLAMVGRFFERIGDHAVNLAERVRYFVTGDTEYLG